MPRTATQAPYKPNPTWIDFRNLTPRQGDFLNCLLAALIAALPCFIEGMITCLGGGSTPGTGEFNPGDRDRCKS